MVEAWQAVAPDWDIAAELQAARGDLERKDREMADQLAIKSFPNASYGSDLDDFVSF